MPNQTLPSPTIEPAAFATFIGIDWADDKHAVCLLVDDQVRHEELPQTAEDISNWVTRLDQEFQGQPIAVILEQSRGALAYALMEFPQLTLFPINPKQASCYREALANSGKKDDPTDAECLARFLREHHGMLRPWRGDDEITRKLGRLCELRRKTVELRKKTGLCLTSTLKNYFPVALDIAEKWSAKVMHALLLRWPTLHDLQRANPKTVRKVVSQNSRRNEQQIRELVEHIRAARSLTTDRAITEPTAIFVQMLVRQLRQFDKTIDEFDKEISKQFAAHPDASIFRSPPGAGAALAPRLLVAFGSDRERFATAAEVQCLSGIAPITRSSGRSHRVQRRYACNKFLRQTFHEFADQARKWSSWSKAYYRSLKARGYRHHAAVRSLAFKWIRILFRCWKDGEIYDEDRYVRQLQKRQVPYLEFLDTA
jgi:transposase